MNTGALRELLNAATGIHSRRKCERQTQQVDDPVAEVFECLFLALEDYERLHQWDDISE